MSVKEMSRREALYLLLFSVSGVALSMNYARTDHRTSSEIPQTEKNLLTILDFFASSQYSYDIQKMTISVSGKLELVISKKEEDHTYELMMPYLVPHQTSIITAVSQVNNYDSLQSALKHGVNYLHSSAIESYSLSIIINSQIQSGELIQNGNYLNDSVHYAFIGDNKTGANKLLRADNFEVSMSSQMDIQSHSTNRPVFSFPENQANVRVQYFAESEYLGGVGVNIEHIEPAIIESPGGISKHDWMSLLSSDMRRAQSALADRITGEYDELGVSNL